MKSGNGVQILGNGSVCVLMDRMMSLSEGRAAGLLARKGFLEKRFSNGSNWKFWEGIY